MKRCFDIVPTLFSFSLLSFSVLVPLAADIITLFAQHLKDKKSSSSI